MSESIVTSNIGAVFYMIWACLHLLAAYSVYVLGLVVNVLNVSTRTSSTLDSLK